METFLLKGEHWYIPVTIHWSLWEEHNQKITALTQVKAFYNCIMNWKLWYFKILKEVTSFDFLIDSEEYRSNFVWMVKMDQDALKKRVTLSIRNAKRSLTSSSWPLHSTVINWVTSINCEADAGKKRAELINCPCLFASIPKFVTFRILSNWMKTCEV